MQDKNHIFEIKNTKFYLPHYPIDVISRFIVDTNDYWDNWNGGALGIINKYLNDNATILDIGANIGSHTLYWAIERNAKKIYSFEPLPDTYNILETNIKLNNLENVVETFNIGLSDQDCRTCISQYNENNIGGTSFSKNDEGFFEFKTLDSFKIETHIDLIKIDVEGAEVEVLNGGIQTITKNKPVIVIETFNHKKEVDKFMKTISYELVDTIREGEDYIYQYKEKKNIFNFLRH